MFYFGGVQKVYAVDVGRFQLAGEVKSDPRVVNLENTDARSLNNRIILNPVDLIVCDVILFLLRKYSFLVWRFQKPVDNYYVYLSHNLRLGREN